MIASATASKPGLRLRTTAEMLAYDRERSVTRYDVTRAGALDMAIRRTCTRQDMDRILRDVTNNGRYVEGMFPFTLAMIRTEFARTMSMVTV